MRGRRFLLKRRRGSAVAVNTKIQPSKTWKKKPPRSHDKMSSPLITNMLSTPAVDPLLLSKAQDCLIGSQNTVGPSLVYNDNANPATSQFRIQLSRSSSAVCLERGLPLCLPLSPLPPLSKKLTHIDIGQTQSTFPATWLCIRPTSSSSTRTRRYSQSTYGSFAFVSRGFATFYFILNLLRAGLT